ncbi:MAG: Spy/CpxP family protein refolding chaperone [Xanthobacteraceae bacterium]
MKKTMTLLTSAAFVAVPLFALPAAAQSPPAPPQGAAPAASQSADQAESRAARIKGRLADEADARIAHIKARLRLTPDQEKNWPGLESELRDLAKKRADRVIAWRAEKAQATKDTSLIDYWRHGADLLSERAANLKALADAAQPLYASLDDRQKERFYELVAPAAGSWDAED